ncbi:DDX58-like protein [Mya arenaria]|uniref:DDX58-like protein n=1 Tax=Mya arenaria TaxID=6604 RepID=A0ABY7F704_MYAAR|nr:DDX58-like protein [Mya arenaria]
MVFLFITSGMTGISKTLSTDSGVGIEIQSGPDAYSIDMPNPHNEDPKKKNEGESILTSHISCESGFSEDIPEQEPEVAIIGVTTINGENEPTAKKRRIDITHDKLPVPNLSPESSTVVDEEIITLTAATAKKRRIDDIIDKLPVSNVSPGMSHSVDEEILALSTTSGLMSSLLIFHCPADEALARSIAAGLEDSFGFVPTVMALTTMQLLDIFVVTAQILVNALKPGKIESLKEFSLIVFDECHHSKKQHMYNEIMSKYLDLKIKCDLSGSDLPQIVGLTASLGVGGKTLAVYGLKYMKQIVANMDAKFLCTVRSEASKTELKRYVSAPKEGKLNLKTVTAVMGASIEDKERLQDCNIPLTFGTDAYQQWSSEFAQTIAKIDSDDIRRVLEPCSKYLEVYNKALLVYNDARLTEAMAILSEFIDDVREVETDHSADSFLLGTYNGEYDKG